MPETVGQLRRHQRATTPSVGCPPVAEGDTNEGRGTARILFVCGVGVGGAPRSTLELASRLASQHRVAVLLGEPTEAGRLYDVATRASIKLRWVGDSTVARLAHRLGRRATCEEGDVTIIRAPIAANAARVAVDRWRPDAVVANSLPRWEMRRLLDHVRSYDIPFVLYAREEHAVTHFSKSGLLPDLAVANSHALAEQIRAHHPCLVVPSVVDTRSALVESSRQDVLSINPALDLTVLEIARHCPEISFLVQESWPLDPPVEREVRRALARLPNVRFRTRVEVHELFMTAKFLLVTAEAGRPRAVAEAQANGIPVLAPDLPALREVVGSGGILFDPASSPAELASLIREAGRPDVYAGLVNAARAESAAEDRRPEAVVAIFEQALLQVIGERDG